VEEEEGSEAMVARALPPMAVAVAAVLAAMAGAMFRTVALAPEGEAAGFWPMAGLGMQKRVVAEAPLRRGKRVIPWTSAEREAQEAGVTAETILILMGRQVRQVKFSGAAGEEAMELPPSALVVAMVETAANLEAEEALATRAVAGTEVTLEAEEGRNRKNQGSLTRAAQVALEEEGAVAIISLLEWAASVEAVEAVRAPTIRLPPQPGVLLEAWAAKAIPITVCRPGVAGAGP
jgi:hypothetical protein